MMKLLSVSPIRGAFFLPRWSFFFAFILPSEVLFLLYFPTTTSFNAVPLQNKYLLYLCISHYGSKFKRLPEMSI